MNHTEVGTIGRRCRWTGHHRWAYAPGWWDARVTPSEQVCLRKGCAAFRIVATPQVDEPNTHIGSYRVGKGKRKGQRIRRIFAWDWGQAAERDPETGEFWFQEA